MTYATRQDLVERFGAAEVEDLEAGPRDDAEAPADARIAAALADAAAEIDAALATRYVQPLPDGRWPRLAGIACDLARLRLYDDVPPEAAVNRARAARGALAGLATGKAALIDEAGNEAPGRGGAQAARTGPEPVMTPDTLEGF